MEIHEIEQFLWKKGNNLRGCTKSDVQRVESHFRISLPAVYKTFLFSMGKDAGQFMRGTSAFYDELFILKEDFEEMLNERGITFPEGAFVFWSHQGYQFAFFLAENGDDPPVYYYREGEDSIRIIAGSLTEFFNNELLMSGFTLD